MANVVDLFFSLSISRQVTRVLLLISLAHTQNIVGKTLIYAHNSSSFYIIIANLANAANARAS